MTRTAGLLSEELNTFLKVIQGSLVVRRHEELYQWLHNDIQSFLPHEILIAAWGDFSLGIVHLDVISKIPGMRTTEVDKQLLLPVLLDFFSTWNKSERSPILVSFNDKHAHSSKASDEMNYRHLITHKRTALIQGIKDERGRQDCLYVLLSPQSQGFDQQASRFMKLLMPYIDTALRQISHLPTQYPDPPAMKIEEGENNGLSPTASSGNVFQLSRREMEIMHWVQLGKTNYEIGLILDISSFTVKNHLQRIFRKIDVLNRAQAVSMMSKSMKFHNAESTSQDRPSTDVDGIH